MIRKFGKYESLAADREKTAKVERTGRFRGEHRTETRVPLAWTLFFVAQKQRQQRKKNNKKSS